MYSFKTFSTQSGAANAILNSILVSQLQVIRLSFKFKWFT